MSVNQSRGDKNEPPQYRRPGRFANPASPRNHSSGGGGGGGSGSSTAPPSSAFSSGKSFKKVVSNAQGAHTRVTGQNPNPNVNLDSLNFSSTGGRASPNDGHIQPPLRGTHNESSSGVTVKPADASVQKSTPGLPKAPQSHAITPTSGTAGATGSVDTSKAFPFQFGSISLGVMNGMQVPARTNSAPPNMDEQKRAQARLDSLKATSPTNPAVPKQQIPRKDVGPVNQPNNASETRLSSNEKKDVSPSIAAHTQKPGPPMPSIPGVSMQIPFHQSQIHLPFSSPNPSLPSQNMANTSLPVPLPMHLPVGNPQQVPPQGFVQGIQHYHPHQGIIHHQSQGLTFSSHIGNMGMPMGLGLQYQQQQPTMANLNFSGTRKTVKITHPDTNEELRLDKRTDGLYPNGGSSGGPRSHLQGPSQSQTGPPFPPAHPINYYTNSYNANPLYFPQHGTQNTPGSQAPRFYNQPASKQVTVKPAVSSHVEKVVDSSPAVVKIEVPKSQRIGVQVTSSTAPVEENATSLVNSEAEAAKKATLSKVEKIGVQSSSDSGVQEASKSVIPSFETCNIVESLNAAGSASACDTNEVGLKSTEIIDSENTLKVERPVVENVGSKEFVDQIQDSTVPEITPAESETGLQTELINNSDDKSSGSISTADLNAETCSLSLGSSQGDKIADKDVDQVNSKEPVSSVEEESHTVPETSYLTLEVDSTVSISPSSSKVKGNNNILKGKKNTKEILKNADARGMTSDFCNAYKRPEEKKETSSAEIVENPSVKDVSSDERRGSTKFEPDDWEDAADISAPKVETCLKQRSEDDNDGMIKKYSRDFLLKFSDHFYDVPEGFEITQDIIEVLNRPNVNMPREPSSQGRGGDRSGVGLRLDRRPSNVGLDDKWSKGMVPGWDSKLGHGVNHGVLRTPRSQPPGQFAGCILSGPMQSPGPHGGPTHRNNSDSDRWQRATGYQKGIMSSPHTPVMHKAERKYEVGKITDEEQAKQRLLKGILNKLTPQNFEKLFEQVKQVNIDNANTLSGVIGQIFDKALMEPTFVEMYANFCSRLSVELPDFSEDNEKITFKRLLLNKCQEEFERGVREQEEANRTEEEGEVKQTEEQRVEKRVKARRRMLGNIRLIGELYKMKMLTERIMHECIKKLLGQDENPDEEDIESLCKLMSTIGEMIDHSRAKEHMDAYFDTMSYLSNNMHLSSRVRFMLKDAIDLRKNKWQQRRKVEGPKKIDEVHRDAAQERQAQSSRLARGPNSNTPIRRGGQMDFSPRPSNVLPSNPQMGGFRGLPQQQQFRGYGNQDPRLDSFENRTLSVPLRPMGGDESITLGPQGGLARGMSVRGQPSMQGMPLRDMDSRRGVGGPNGYGAILERSGYSPRDDLGSRYNMPERFSPRPVYNPSSMQEHNMNYVNRNTGRGFDRVPPEVARASAPPQSGQVLSEDRLRDKSIQAIKEFYSVRNEKKVVLWIKDLNTPSFYPTMISNWVTDSFERTNMDRDSLSKLLINLAKSHDGILSQESFVKGFESVLSSFVDAVKDAPIATEYLGQIFARILMENIVHYKQVWRLIYEGGEEQGQLVEVGLAAEVLGVILEIIKSEKGDPFLKSLLEDSNPRLENFYSSSMKKASRLDKFI